MSTQKTVTIGQFLSDDEIKRAFKYKENAKEICEHIIKPNIDKINRKLGQENDPMYLAYMVQYALTLSSKSLGESN